MLINSVKNLLTQFKYKLEPPFHPKYLHYIISATTFSTLVIILVITLQLLMLNEYSTSLLRIQTYISHISALFFLSILIYLFIRWLTLKKGYVVSLYCASLSFIAIALICALIYLDSYFYSNLSSAVKPYPILLYVFNFEASPLTNTLSGLFDIFYLSSFLIMWISTTIVLNQYRHRLGALKYFTIVSIPLIYYLFPIQNYFTIHLFPFLDSSPAIYAMIDILFFSATKQVGAVFFGLTFWFASQLVYDERIRSSLLISSIGLTMLYGSIALTPLQYSLYPPYGLITEAFLPLGAFMILVGIFTSALHISRDASVRRELYRNAISQLNLLRSIGTSEMEREFEGRVKYLEKAYRISENADRSHREEQVDIDNVKKILHEVLEEVYSKDKKGGIAEPT
jgi:hypothetical protein